eukprot:g6909.t1
MAILKDSYLHQFFHTWMDNEDLSIGQVLNVFRSLEAHFQNEFVIDLSNQQAMRQIEDNQPRISAMVPEGSNMILDEVISQLPPKKEFSIQDEPLFKAFDNLAESARAITKNIEQQSFKFEELVTNMKAIISILQSKKDKADK